MKILRKNEVAKKKEERELREYYFFPDFDNFEFVITHMPHGRHQKPHGHEEVNEAIYVISGEINVKQNGTEGVLKSGDAVLFEKRKLHTVANESENNARILTIKQPRKSDDKIYGTSVKGNSPNQKALLTALEQNWLHARHAENGRLWFTSIYAAIIAGSLSFLIKGNTPLDDVPIIPLLLFFILLSTIGIIVSVKLGLEFHQHITFATEIAKNKKVELEKCIGKPLGSYEKKEMKTPWVLSVGSWFLIFYITCWSGFFGWLFYILSGNFICGVVISFIMSILIGFFIRRHHKNKSKKISEFIRRSVSNLDNSA